MPSGRVLGLKGEVRQIWTCARSRCEFSRGQLARYVLAGVLEGVAGATLRMAMATVGACYGSGAVRVRLRGFGRP